MGTKTVQWPANIAVYHPDSNHDAFIKATERWSIYKAPSFDSVVQPKTEQEVAEVVKIARASNVPFLATGGRHGYTTTLGALQGGLAIDLSKMNEFNVDAASATITVGPGALIGDINGPILEAGYQMPVGSCAKVGVIGVTVGTGVGLFQGVFGLMIDALLSVRIVTANGNIVEASASSKPDLFWGIRGAGSNFGIITSATYKLTKAVNNGQVFTADIIYPAGLRAGYFAALKTFENTMPAELAINTTISWSPDTNETQIIGTFIYSGPESQARQVLAPFFDLKSPVARVSVVPYSQVPEVILFGMIAAMGAPGGIRDIFSANVRQLSMETFNMAFEKFDAFYKEHPDGRGCACMLESFSNQAVTAVASDATAYPWRESKGNFMFQMGWPELGNPIETVANAFARELRDDFAATSGYPDLAVYVSYAHGDEKIEQIYGKEKMPRLAALKKQWDPENIFKYNNALPTEYP
ncbi:FAD-binding domain-containing protein [Hypoxylon rubiginosum]|uniref:FAD-binding domain-containing protein n=1 Tax=Hypoxylon rubiginosum TaxID=110542 RepID=A0ACC0CSL0_9PEZI|nr:FAD-binding domain-containing protein [Hypoxylon rubiginosum]